MAGFCARTIFNFAIFTVEEAPESQRDASNSRGIQWMQPGSEAVLKSAIRKVLTLPVL